MEVAILIPSRGMIFTETLNSVLDNVMAAGVPSSFLTENMKPIPDAQNDLVLKALQTNADYFFFVEEDMFFPKNTLLTMLEVAKKYDCDGVIVDYPVGDHWSTVCHKDDQIMWFGFGCTLIKREVFQNMPYPWFETNKSVKITDTAHLEYTIDEGTPSKYGGHDILFGLKCHDLKLKFAEVSEIQAGQLRLVELGKTGYNNGVHNIVKLEGVEKIQNYYSKLQKGGQDGFATFSIHTS